MEPTVATEPPIESPDAAPAAVVGTAPQRRAVIEGGGSRRSASRPVVESLLLLFAGMLLIRTFAAEAYIVPTGSMAPTLLGIHRDLACPDCGFRFALGVDEDGRAGRPICPNCAADLDGDPGTGRNGDRLLVQKNFYRWRRPHRWEVAVFLNPAEPDQAYVKRVVGLPGESVEIAEGDVYINGDLARKGLDEQRGIRVLVHDSRHAPEGPSWFPRWRVARVPGGGESGWVPLEQGAFRRPAPSQDVVARDPDAVDWLEYRHVDPDRADYGPIRDFVSYNGARVGSGRRVGDLMIEAELELEAGVTALAVRFQGPDAPLLLHLPLGGQQPPSAFYDGRDHRTDANAALIAAAWARKPGPRRLLASFFDHRLLVALDGVPLFEALDLSPPIDPAAPPSPDESPLAFGVSGPGAVVAHRLLIYRDVYYTDGLPHAPGRPFGVGEPYVLDDGEYFVLGDNSAVSNDSRFWAGSPVVPESMLLGKPFLVHLPSRGVPLKVFGRETYWVPDLREIRYIR